MGGRRARKVGRVARGVAAVDGKRIVVGGCGAGTAIPSVRSFARNIADMQGTLIRINPREPQVPVQHVGLPLGALEAINALDAAIFVVDGTNTIVHVNIAGEHFLQGSANYLKGRPLFGFLPPDNPLFSLIEQVRDQGFSVSEYGVTLESPRIGRHLVNLQAAPLLDTPNAVAPTLQQWSIADKIDRQLTHRGAARSVTALASMLAHEVKNPLSGIRGAAQLLEQNANPEDVSLTTLIREESDRICDLVDRMEVFSDAGPLQRDPVNIHQVLDRVMQLAKNGFGRHLRYLTNFDPSLPAVFGHRDQLVQVFLNLIKNAAEAAPQIGRAHV